MTFDRIRADRVEAARVEYAGRLDAARRGELGREAQEVVRRVEIRDTCRALSDRALAFQIGTGVGGMHREELLAEQARRERGV